ncbi:DUF2235 domain-containing protein [Actinomycetospora soli]|uniref:DUF2235 domain-containing protein n=1 Tax=Actinomycetospora soli TaxID=2893887 RepID=UPI001E601C8D|nr:DUF2235 domain-containing protein [Actinomycetospora soli]MCD2188830.1 DUF2235 domain-containing protein [Actinomycetospora soli]
MKRVVVCCDGTWNVADPTDGSPTNVVKFALNVAERDGAGVEQVVSYDPGVGTGVGDRVRGGVFGFGLSRNVREAYRFLAENVDDGDEIHLVGFSRGAFTVRSVAGLIENCGLLRPAHAHRVDEAYRIYRGTKPDDPSGRIAADLFRRTYGRRVEIRFLGVFDTVGALGIPFSGPRLGKVLNGRWAFHNTDLGPSVRHACHALAIDERRKAYQPSLWTQGGAGQDVEQVWFRGVHSEVGGGASDAALSDIALLWLAERAHSNGLAFVDDAFQDPGPATREARRRGKTVHPDAGSEPSTQGFWWGLAGGLADREFGREVGDPPRVGRNESVASSARGTALPPSFAEAEREGRLTAVALSWPEAGAARPRPVAQA